MILVLIPTFNCSDSLEYTLKNSVIESLKHRFLIVDNMSTDNTVAIAKSYGIEVHENTANLGRVENWNKCLEIAKERKSEFCKLLFAGDILHKDAIDIYTSAFKDPQVGFVCGAYNVLEQGINTRISHFKREKILLPEESLKMSIKKNNWFGPPSCQAFRTKVLEGVKYNTSMPWVADWLLSIELSKITLVSYSIHSLATFNVTSRKYYKVYKAELSARLEELSVLIFLSSQYGLEHPQIYKKIAKKLTVLEIVRILGSKLFQKFI